MVKINRIQTPVASIQGEVPFLKSPFRPAGRVLTFEKHHNESLQGERLFKF